MKGKAVSEVIGAIILIAVAVLAIGIVILVLFSGPLPTRVPAFSGLISNSSKAVYISHEGGDTLYVGQFKILVDYGAQQGVDETYNFTKSLSANVFSLGKVMNATLPNMPSRVVMVYNTSWGGGTVLLAADLVRIVPFTPIGWYSIDWLDRKKITIDHTQVPGSLTDFPVLIRRADTDLDYDARDDGNDILFTAGDGTTKLAHEIEFYDDNGGTLVAWVKVLSVKSDSDTIIYMYYGNPAAASQQEKTNVWSNGYVGVWHLGEATASTRFDSTGNHNDLSDTNGVAMYSPGRIGDAAEFVAASSERLTISDAAQTGLDITGPITMEAWVNTDLTAPTPFYLIEKDRGGTCGGQPPYYLRLNNGNSGYVRENMLVNGSCTTGSGINGPSMTSMVAGTWYHLAGVYDGSYTRIYKDGGQTNSEAYNSGIFNSDGAFSVGGRVSTQYFDGLIDEVRISSTARSPEWIATEYANQKVPSSFYSVSTEQTPITMN